MDYFKTNVSNRRNENVQGPRGPAFAPILWMPKYLDSPLILNTSSVDDTDVIGITTAESDFSDFHVPVSTDKERIAAFSEKPRDRCVSHMDPSRWVRSPVSDRIGWEEARCQDCGTFIGFNPIPESAGLLTENRAIKPDRALDLGLHGSDSLSM
jgi:hypothetical protein